MISQNGPSASLLLLLFFLLFYYCRKKCKKSGSVCIPPIVLEVKSLSAMFADGVFCFQLSASFFIMANILIHLVPNRCLPFAVLGHGNLLIQHSDISNEYPSLPSCQNMGSSGSRNQNHNSKLKTTRDIMPVHTPSLSLS